MSEYVKLTATGAAVLVIPGAARITVSPGAPVVVNSNSVFMEQARGIRDLVITPCNIFGGPVAQPSTLPSKVVAAEPAAPKAFIPVASEVKAEAVAEVEAPAVTPDQEAPVSKPPRKPRQTRSTEGSK